MELTVRPLEPSDVASCAEVLYGLPQWFGIEASNREYVESLRTLPAAVACTDAGLVGFIALTTHTPQSVEIHVMGVDPAMHRRRVGTALVRWAETWCRARSVHWLHVKTRGPSTPDPNYARTRAFYIACGFEPLFESLALWGPENAALVLVKRIEPVSRVP